MTVSASAPAAAPAVRIAGLTVSYRRRGRLLRVLRDVSLDIRPGEAYGLVGESGCGKTTVAMALMRHLAPNAVVEAGRIEFAGVDVLTLGDPELRALRGDRMAMVYQDPGSALNPSIRVGAQLAEIYRHHRGLAKADALDAAASMLGLVQVSDPKAMLRRYTHELSGGQQQRVMIAMAMATDPDLLVLDEPTTGLDATVEAEVLDLVEQLRDRFSAAILFVSHNLGIVARMCERVGVLYAGRLIEQGPGRELFADPRHPYTQMLLDAHPRLDGTRVPKPRLTTDTPSPYDIPAGCRFHPRCPLAEERCLSIDPPEVEVPSPRGGHVSACHVLPMQDTFTEAAVP